MDQTPKLTKRDKDKDKRKKRKKKDKEKSQIDCVDVSSPVASPSKTTSTPKTPVTSSQKQLSGFGGSSTAQKDATGTSQSTLRSNRYDPFTYNSQLLPVFSSNNPVDPPLVRAKVNTSERSRTNDTERSSYSNEFKIKTLEICLSLKDRYLAIPPASHADQEPFWGRLLELLELMPLTKGKFKEWKEANRAVESWCQMRRTSMRENRLPAVSQSHPELDSVIDQWNLIFAQRFCKIHGGYFANTIWPQFVGQKLKEMVKDEVNSWITKSLRERRNELQRFGRPTLMGLLSSNSSVEDYDNALEELQTQFVTGQRDETQVIESEVVISMVLKLQPELRTAISQFLENPREPTRRTEPSEGSQQSSGYTDSRQRVSFAIPSTGTSVRAANSAPASLSFPVTQTIPGLSAPQVASASTARSTATNPTQDLDKLKAQPLQNGSSAKPFIKIGEDPSRKRKDPEPPTGTIATSINSGAGGIGENAANTAPQDQAKRPRLDKYTSDLPPASDLTLKCRETRDSRSPPFRRPPTGPGHTRNEGLGPQGHSNKLPLPMRSPVRPCSPAWTRSVGPGYRNDSDYNSGRSRPPRYQDQNHESRHRGVDSYRPPPRATRETTVEFQGMTLQQQNMSLLRQIKEVQSMVEKKNDN
ncbi:hypothetical protein FLONG3_391 [Fusarium longipes]|uniref:Uncharacterized protein n=1 Tax=Fusarium longipes TaxID=694270 RepID=A0A395TB16_9HYPO|nr:hypothetical protein FLONG3_391 [Fusarium longipes]